MSSILKSIVTTLRITTNVARVLFLATVGMAIVTGYLKLSFAEVSHKTLSLHDYMAVALYAMVALLFAWLGFSKKGKDLLANDGQYPNDQSTRRRMAKVSVASIGVAGGIWLVLIVLSLIVGGPDMVVQMFDGRVILVLIVISIPIAYKWLK